MQFKNISNSSGTWKVFSALLSYPEIPPFPEPSPLENNKHLNLVHNQVKSVQDAKAIHCNCSCMFGVDMTEDSLLICHFILMPAFFMALYF